jgi:Tfp pilus assembly PilM family ATPase
VSRTISMLKFGKIRPPVRRVLALDAGSRCIKLLLAESDFGRLRILKEELIDLQAEGLVAADEIKAHLQASLEKWGRPPLALVLPQHLSTSQIVDLPIVSDREAEKLIEDEAIKLTGVSESRIIYDFVRAETAAKNRQQFWVTLAQEGDIRERIARLGLEREDLCELTTTANALIAAYRAASPLASRAVLVHLGAETTAVVVLVAGQGTFATSFQMGGDFFMRALARARNCSEESAETLKRAQDLLNGPEADSEFAGIVLGWVAELKRQLNDWFQHNAGVASDLAGFELIASGGGFAQPGLLGYLKSQAGLALQSWPKPSQADAVSPANRFEVAFGAALQALGYTTQSVSLLPDDYRAAWRKRLGRQRLELASLVLLAICAVLLSVGTWRKYSLIGRREALAAKIQAAQEAEENNELLAGELIAEYESFRPLFASQQSTLDTLKTLALLQESRSNRSFWYVLLADQQSYFNPPSALTSTNRPAGTNLVVASAAERTAMLFTSVAPVSAATTNGPAKPGLIAELCVPEDAEASRAILRQLVNDLKQQPLFSKVDQLSGDLRQNLADPKVIIPDRRFVLALDFAGTDFQAAQRLKPPLNDRAVRPGTRRPVARTTSSRPLEDAGRAAQTIP